MKVFYLVAVVAAIAAVGADARGVETFEEHPIDWYNCAGVKDGNYPSPRRCTEFISCSGGVASQRECAECHVDPVLCPDGQTVYDAPSDKCLWANETTCSAGTNQPTESTSEATEPTESSSESSSSTTTEGPEEPKEGDPCNEGECKNSGRCDRYLRCINGSLVTELCDDDLFWNRRANGTEHGGNCNKFDTLPDDIKEEYWKDEKCLKCYWKEISDCSQSYLYLPPKSNSMKPTTLYCDSTDLVFSVAKQTCVRCQNKIDTTTNKPCCP